MASASLLREERKTRWTDERDIAQLNPGIPGGAVRWVGLLEVSWRGSIWVVFRKKKKTWSSRQEITMNKIFVRGWKERRELTVKFSLILQTLLESVYQDLDVMAMYKGESTLPVL